MKVFTLVCNYKSNSDVIVFFFFFKQKTAYEMRISDWSSDVCSSDLIDRSMLGDDPEMLEDMLAAAINDAVNKANALSQERMGDATAGLSLPPGMKIPGLF